MSRKRYISTDISTDTKLAELAEHGVLPLLLFTWSIPHMDDWGRMTGDARQFKLLVCPALDVTTREVDEALEKVASVGLWVRYESDSGLFLQMDEKRWHYEQIYNHTRKEWEALRQKVRTIIFERDGYKCKFCESTDHLEIDHIIPISKGGTNDIYNLQTLCRTCNRRKGDREWPEKFS